jgi:hypothetical protein
MPMLVSKRQFVGETQTRTMTTVVSVGQFNTVVNDNPVASNSDGPGDADLLLQQYIKAKGVRPCVYRVSYRRHKEPQGCTVTNKGQYKSLVCAAAAAAATCHAGNNPGCPPSPAACSELLGVISTVGGDLEQNGSIGTCSATITSCSLLDDVI